MRVKSIYQLLGAGFCLLIIFYGVGQNTAKADASFEPANVGFRQIATGLTQPVFITNAEDASERLFIVERAGRIRIVKNGALLSTAYLDIQSIVNSTGSEQGLLALAFHPNYESNGRFYTVHTIQNGSLVLSRFTRSSNNPDLADANSKVTVLTIPHPTNQNHNGGTLAFGPDGYLYWSTGDGGGGGDPSNNAQNLNSLLGKILRIDIDSASPYSVPASNPFFNNPSTSVRKEIWAYGLRNPWRFSFDRETGDLFIGDVGQSAREEIDFQPAASTGGENYGWRVMEGTICYNPASGCDQSGKVLPITDYDHSLGCSVTGGYIYRGLRYPAMQSQYFYSDICSGRLFSIFNDPINGWTETQIGDTPYSVSTFGEDEQGELYFADYGAGKIYQICYGLVASPSCNPSTISGNVGISGVTLSYTDGIARTTTSLNDGSYSFSVSYNWNGTVTPSHACFTFSPTNRSYSNIITNQSAQNYTPTFNPSSGCADVDVSITGNNVGNYDIPAGKSIADRYGINGGPVLVSSTNGLPVFTSQRAIFGSSFNSIVGYPADQLTTDYWFTSYDDVGMITYLVIGNPHPTLNAVVDVYIGGIKRNATPYSIAPGQRIFPRYGINAGPVHVVSTNGVNIFTSERTKYLDSFNEVMGIPGDQLTTDYWFTSYDDLGMITYLVIGNPHPTLTAEVDVYIGGIKRNAIPYAIAPGQRIFPRYGINSGPVRVVSTNGVDIFSSERTKFGNSFNEVLGYPADQLTTDYWFTSYDDASMITYLVIGNPDPTLTAEVEVYIAGALANTYSIAPGQRVFPRYGIDEGPVNVISTNGVNVFTSERSKYLSSFNEILGLSNDQLTTDYWFTSYDDLGMDTELVISVP